MNQVTHDSLRSLVYSLPKQMQDRYFTWRREEAAAWRQRDRVGFDFAGPEFVAHCMQQLLTMHQMVDKRIALFAGPEPDSNTERNLTDGTTEG